MLNNFRKTFVLVAVVATLSTGCKYSKQYQKLTEAGDKYTTAVDELLIKASELQVDSSSEQLLLDDRITSLDETDYEDINQKDREILEIIGDIRNHNQLLGNYFAKLKELAYSEQPEKVQGEIEGIANNLQKVSSKLQNNNSFPRSILLGNVGKLIVHSKIDSVLKEELEKRNQTILKELTIQKEMLNKLSDFMKHRSGLVQKSREQRLVIRPLTEKEPIADESVPQWIQQRKEIFFIDQRIKELEQASHALEDFQNVYTASVEGKINSQTLNDSLKDIDSFLVLLENNPQSNQTNPEEN